MDIEAHDHRLQQIELIVIDNPKEGLNEELLLRIMAQMDSRAKLYLCGPDGLKSRVITSWQAASKTGRVHSEKFDFRDAIGLTNLIYIGRPVLEKAREKLR